MTNIVITGADINTSGSINISDIYKKMLSNPVGTTKQSILSEAEFQARAGNGWVRADGRSLAVASYPELFAEIGYTYGGAGANFNIPNMISRYSRMSGTYSIGTCQSNTTSSACLSLGQPSVYFSGNTSFSKSSQHCHNSGDLRSDVAFDYSCMRWNGCTNLNGPSISFGPSCILNVSGSGPFCVSTTISSASSNQTKLLGYTCCIGISNQNTFRINTASLPAFSSGDSETRPVSIVLNWLMRVK